MARNLHNLFHQAAPNTKWERNLYTAKQWKRKAKNQIFTADGREAILINEEKVTDW